MKQYEFLTNCRINKLQNMKSLNIGILVLTLIFGFSACSTGQNKDGESKANPEIHEEHKSLANNFAHKNIIILENPYEVGSHIQKKFSKLFNSYISMSKSFFKGDVNAVDQGANKMIEVINDIPMEAFKNEGKEAWGQHSKTMVDKLEEMRHIKGIDEKRSYFSHISEIMYCSYKSFEWELSKVYAAYCPMAFNGKGAYWLTNNKAIENPYFGHAMPNCGEIKEEM